jgi:flagellar biosynthetic protein FliR
MLARSGLVFMLALVVHQPLDAADLHQLSPLGYFVAAVSEFGIGLSIGFVCRLVLAVGEVAADSIAPIMGLGAAQMFDPTLGGQGSVLTLILRYVGTWVALAVGLHHLLLSTIFWSFSSLPTGTLINPGSLAPLIIRMTSDVLIAGVKLGLPFVAILFITQVGLAFIARAAPAMQIFSIGFAVTLGVGGLLWIVFAPDVVRELMHLRSWAETHLSSLLQALKGLGRGG